MIYIVLWILSYVVCAAISIWINSKVAKEFTLEDFFIIVVLGIFPFLAILICLGFAFSFGDKIVLWRKK